MKFLDGSTSTFAPVAVFVRQATEQGLVMLGTEVKEQDAGAVYASQLHVDAFRCDASSCPMSFPAEVDLDVGTPILGAIEFTLPSAGVARLGVDTISLRVVHRGVLDPSRDCDGDSTAYEDETFVGDPEFSVLDAMEEVVTITPDSLGGWVASTSELFVDGGDCTDRGLSFTRSMSGFTDTCFTDRTLAANTVRCGKRNAAGVFEFVDLPLKDDNEDHPGFDRIPSTGEKLAVTHSNTKGAGETHFVNVRFPLDVFTSGTDTPVVLAQSTGTDGRVDRPFLNYNPGAPKRMVAAWHERANDEGTMLHAVKVRSCVSPQTTGCDLASEWEAATTPSSSATLEHRNAEVVFDDKLEVVVFQREINSGTEDYQVFYASRCRTAATTPWSAPVAVKTPEVIGGFPRAQSLERGKPFVVLNPFDNLVHIAFVESPVWDQYALMDVDAFWSVFAYQDCP